MEMTEAKIQQDIVKYYNNTYCLAHHSPRGLIMSIPNEGKGELIRTGLLPGASDLIVFLPFGGIFFVEVKTPTGKQSDKQKDFEARIKKLGYEYILVRSLEDFKEQLEV